MRTVRRKLVVSVAIAAFAVACSSSATVVAPIPSGKLSLLPTTSPGGATGALTTGNATVHITGAFSADLTLDTLGAPAIYLPPPGASALTWTSSTGPGSLAIAGPTRSGTNLTSTALSVVVTVQVSGVTYTLPSTSGTCTVTVTQEAAAAFAGTFSCRGLHDPTRPANVDAQGTFLASG